MVDCLTPAGSRRKLFWATQPDACGTDTRCVEACGSPGLELVNTDQGSSFATNDWVRGLIINMLMTDGLEPPTDCGYRPGSRGGHWSESYMSGPASVGTLVRTVPPSGTVRESVNLIASYAQATLERLVLRGVARSVDVEANYLGNNRIELNIVVVGSSGDNTKVGLTGSRTTNGWVWDQ